MCVWALRQPAARTGPLTKFRTGAGLIPGLGVYVTFERVFAQKARPQDLVNYISQFPMVPLVRLLCGIGAISHNSSHATPFDIQQNFADEFRDNSGMKRVIELLTAEPDNVFVSEEQVASLIKYALLNAHSDHWPSDAGDLLVRMLLVYNSLRGVEHEPKRDDRDTFMNFELRAAANFDESLAAIIARFAAFFDWARTDADAKASPNYLDLDADFSRFYGMSYMEWAAAAFAFLTHFRRITNAAEMEKLSPVLDVNVFLSSVGEQTILRAWLGHNSVSIDDAIAFFKRMEEGNKSYAGIVALLPFMRRPLLAVASDQVCAPYLPYLENSLGLGIFFALLDGYNEHGERENGKKFTRFFGEFFEDHIVNLIRDAHPTPALVFGEMEYVKGSKSTDLVIFEGDAALFIDITSSRFNVAKTLVALDPEAIEKDVEKIVLANAEQLDGSIAAFRDGRLTYPGIDASKIKRIFPIVLSLQALPRAFEFNKRVLDGIAAKGLLAGCERLEMLTAEDAQGLPDFYAAGVTLSEMLDRKLKHSHPKARNDSLKNYPLLF